MSRVVNLVLDLVAELCEPPLDFLAKGPSEPVGRGDEGGDGAERLWPRPAGRRTRPRPRPGTGWGGSPRWQETGVTTQPRMDGADGDVAIRGWADQSALRGKSSVPDIINDLKAS